jgi:hypothetical protein
MRYRDSNGHLWDTSDGPVPTEYRSWRIDPHKQADGYVYAFAPDYDGLTPWHTVCGKNYEELRAEIDCAIAEHCGEGPAREARFHDALTRISTLRPAGDVNTARNTRLLVQQMERIALDALADKSA